MVGISIIMPVFNVSDLLYTSIGSIQKQTMKNIEIICVDDGSTDDSLDILTELQKKYLNIKIIKQKNSGPGIARNNGIKEAKGEYISFLDADDIFLDDYALEKMYKIAKENKSEMVGANLKFINKNFTLNEFYDFINTRFTYYSKKDTLKSEEYGIPFAFYKNIYNKDFLTKNNILFPNQRAGEDPIFMTKVLVNIKEFIAIPIDLYGYNHSMGGGVNEKINSYDKKFEYIKHFKEAFDILKKHNYLSTFSDYKIEFIDYLLYSKNMYDYDIQKILSEVFYNYKDYFNSTEYGFFIMDYILNHDFKEDFQKIEEFVLIKKCLFEESCIENNFIDKRRLIDYLSVRSSNRYNVNDLNLMKTSFSVLNNIKENTTEKYETINEEIEQINNKIYSETYDKNAEFLRKFNECRIDVKNIGSSDNRVEIVDCDDSLCEFFEPVWLKDGSGVGTVVNSVRGSLNFSFRCVNDGTLMLSFKGVDFRDKLDNRIPVFIDYTDVVVDGETLIRGSKVCWHDDPFEFFKDVKNGQIVNVQLKWQPLHTNSNSHLLDLKDYRLNLFSKCRVDVKNHGQKGNDIEILSNDDGFSNVYKPDWFIDNQGIGTVVSSDKETLNFSFECINEGKLQIEFRAAHFSENNSNKPIFITYNEISVDDIPLINEEKIVWHDTPIIYNNDVKNGQIIKVKVKWHSMNKSVKTTPTFIENDISQLNNDIRTKTTKINELRKQIQTLQKENNELNLFKEDFLHSNSWKLTEPLRKMNVFKR